MRRLFAVLGLSLAVPVVTPAQEAVPPAPRVEAPRAPAPPTSIPRFPFGPDNHVPGLNMTKVVCVTPRGYCTFHVPHAVGAGTACHCGDLNGVVN